MKNLLSDHPALTLALVFFVGWTLHWIVGLLFFRSRYFEQEAEITRQSKALEDARFQLGRTQTDLQSKADLVEAIQRSKSAVESRVGTLESELRATRGTLAEVTALAETHAAAARAATRSPVLPPHQNPPPSDRNNLYGNPLHSVNPILEARIQTLKARADALESRLQQLTSELTESQGARRDLFAKLAAEQSVRATLTRAIQSRDESITELSDDREGVKESLMETERSRAEALTERDELRAGVLSARGTLEAERKARTQMEQTLKERETQLAELELKSQEYQAAFNDAAEENQRITQDLKQTRARLTSSESTLKESTRELRSLKDRLAQAETELTQARTTIETIGQTNREFLDGRDKEIVRLTAEMDAAKARSEQLGSAHAELEDQLATHVRELRKLKDQNEELVEELQAATKANQSLTEQLAHDIPTVHEDTDTDSQLSAVLADLDTVSRERNELAAELAALKSIPATPKRTKKETLSTENPPENQLL